MPKDSSKRARLSKEVEEIRRLRDLNKLLKAGDFENALLSNSAKDSETLNDNVYGALLDRADAEERGTRGLEVIERLTMASGTGRIVKQKNVKISRKGGKVTVQRKIHLVKKASPKRKR
ncbi:MAG: hypothetical protein LVQ95_05005 [Candidatus Micrarchaeales archaeon]|nr:hypothetical protein [Candidatus Micrarchaeales archaeon]